MENVGRMDVLESTEDLVEEVADVVVAEVLRLQQFVEIGLHQCLDDVANATSRRPHTNHPSSTIPGT